MKIDSIVNGIVIDHIPAGKVMEVYDALELDKLNCSIAILKNVKSQKMGSKDILKIDHEIDINLDVLGYIDPSITVSFIKDQKTQKKMHLNLPRMIINIEKCKNPRCITSKEHHLEQKFYLANASKRIYRCYYCDSRIEKTK